MLYGIMYCTLILKTIWKHRQLAYTLNILSVSQIDVRGRSMTGELNPIVLPENTGQRMLIIQCCPSPRECPRKGERYFMSLKQPAVGLEHCAMSDEQDECPESYKQSHSL